MDAIRVNKDEGQGADYREGLPASKYFMGNKSYRDESKMV